LLAEYNVEENIILKYERPETREERGAAPAPSSLEKNLNEISLPLASVATFLLQHNHHRRKKKKKYRCSRRCSRRCGPRGVIPLPPQSEGLFLARQKKILSCTLL
jgi:hypothetical protein